MRETICGAIAALAAIPAGAAAQANCAEREVIVDRLEDRYGESFAGGGMQNTAHLFEVWASEEKGTWTILLTRADGSSCIIASGSHWREGLPKVEGTPS